MVPLQAWCHCFLPIARVVLAAKMHKIRVNTMAFGNPIPLHQSGTPGWHTNTFACASVANKDPTGGILTIERVIDTEVDLLPLGLFLKNATLSGNNNIRVIDDLHPSSISYLLCSSSRRKMVTSGFSSVEKCKQKVGASLADVRPRVVSKRPTIGNIRCPRTQGHLRSFE